MACPGSVILEDLFEDEGSVYAEEGTTAHAVAEARLRAEFDPTDALLIRGWTMCIVTVLRLS